MLPAGEFQPPGLDLWRSIVREYSEELLDRPIADDFSAEMTKARNSGKLRAYVLGIVLAP